ncbi:MAG: hypothetical protein LW750_03575 [Bacteroidetes bacterium]|jgi:hypothetical protein|nr:hypothetical protein [Bacteroidota bacterium]
MRSIVSISLIAVIWNFVSCKPEPVYPAEPILKFKQFVQTGTNDTLKAVFSFTDGDGDIGIAVNSTDSNMVLTLYYQKPDGSFAVVDNPTTVDPNDSVFYNYRIPELPDGQKGLEGDIYLTINKAFIPYDTIQFNAFLLDQRGNKSELVRTPSEILIR